MAITPRNVRNHSPDSPRDREYGPRVPRSARRTEQYALAERLRAADAPAGSIGRALRETYGINARLAQRIARGWTQEEVAAEWSRRWPGDPKTFKNISYWENWPGPTGHAPSLAVLDRLAQLYECNVTDLVADWGTHADAEAASPVEAETWAWQVQHLALPELTRSIGDWATRLPTEERRTLVLKLSTAVSAAAGPSTASPERRQGVAPRDLEGAWTSVYSYVSTRRGEMSVTYPIELEVVGDRLLGRSPRTATGSLELDLVASGLLVTGSWTERTAADGYYAGAVYHGVIQLVMDPAGRTMRGRWLGPDREFTIDSGPWQLERAVAPQER